MQNAECKVQNCGLPPAGFKIFGEANAIILHFELCILHYNNQMGCKICSPFGYL